MKGRGWGKLQAIGFQLLVMSERSIEMDTFQQTTTYVVETCCNCHVQFGMTKELQKQRLKDGGWFYCPNGHAQHYSESDEFRWKKLNENLRETVEYYRNQNQVARLSLRAAKGQVTKLKKKVAAGLCPCCEKSFANLKKHMEKSHPDFVEVEKDVQNN